MTHVSHQTEKFDPESAPARVSPTEVRLYDGKSFASIAANILPGFVLLECTNRAPNALLWASCSITPVKEGAKFHTRLNPVTIPPASKIIFPLAYSSASACECIVLMTFRREMGGAEGRWLHICQTRAYLVPASANSF